MATIAIFIGIAIANSSAEKLIYKLFDSDDTWNNTTNLYKLIPFSYANN